MRVSLCLMVRNEKPLIEQAIRSAEGLADEIIVVDTGSTDKTVEIARSLGAIVIEGGDRRNKAAGRNMALDAATGDWVVILDADEVIADPVGMRTFLESTTGDVVYIRESYMDGDRITNWFHQMRCWRRGLLRYRFRAHEVPMPAGETWPVAVHSDFVWEHRPPKDRTWKRDHMLMLLLLDVDENPGEPRPLFYLGREYMYHKAWGAAIDTLNKYLSVARPHDHDVAEAWGHLATCYLGQGKPAEVRRCLHQALALQPERRDWYGWLATAYDEAKMWQQAAGLLLTAVHLPPPTTGYVDELWNGPHLYDLLARCLFYAGRKDEGRVYAQQALSMAPDDARLQANLRWFET